LTDKFVFVQSPFWLKLGFVVRHPDLTDDGLKAAPPESQYVGVARNKEK
jgi:hypothetical protein